MAVPHENATLQQRVKSLEQAMARLTLQASQTVAAVQPTAVMPNSTWVDSSNGNLLNAWDGTAWVPAPVGTAAIDIGAVTSQSTQFRPGGGMLSNLIPDPEFLDQVWRDTRTANDGFSTWTFAPVPQLAPGTLAGWTFGAKVTGNSVTAAASGPRGSWQIQATINTALVASDLLLQSATMAVVGNRVYQAYIVMDTAPPWTMVIEWLTAASALISTTTLTGASALQPVTSPSTAAFARIKVTANTAVATGTVFAIAVAFYLGGAGVEPGDWTAGITLPDTFDSSSEVTLVRNIPISRVQDYYGDLTGYAVNCTAEFTLREYDANGVITDTTSVGGPVIQELATTPGWVGDSGPIFAVQPNTVSADLVLTVTPVVYGQVASVQITQPVLALTGFVSRDGKRNAVFSPQQLRMQGTNASASLDSDAGLTSFSTGNVATAQDQGVSLNSSSKLATLWSGASAVIQAAIAKARIAFGTLSWLELTSTLADLRGPTVQIGDGTNNITVIGNNLTATTYKQTGSALNADLSDTGWVNLTINAGFAWRTGFAGQIRRIGNVVFMKGHVDRTVGTWTTGTPNPVTIPAGFRPIAQHDFTYAISSNANPAVITVIQAYVTPAGAVNSFSGALTANGSGSNNMSLSNAWITT